MALLWLSTQDSRGLLGEGGEPLTGRIVTLPREQVLACSGDRLV